MPQPNINNLDSPVGPLRDRYIQTIGVDDVEFPTGVICQVAAPATGGVLEYQTLVGTADQTETLAEGEFPNVNGVAVLLKLIRGSSTVTSVVIGAL